MKSTAQANSGGDANGRKSQGSRSIHIDMRGPNEVERRVIPSALQWRTWVTTAKL
jgi:hypothetical protein